MFASLRFPLLIGLAVFVSAAAADAAELLMFERAGCPWCARWNRDVAPIYPRTSEGQMAPLRRIDIESAPPQNLVLTMPVRFTPTFVLVDGGREIGRITGYANDDFFWGLLSDLLSRVARPEQAAAQPCKRTVCP